MKLFLSWLIPAVLLTAVGFELAGAPTAAELYKTKCAMCHGADGSGNTVMGKKLELKDLRAEATQRQTDAQLAAVIESGKETSKGKMQGQKGQLPAEAIRSLVGYIRELAEKR